MKKEEKPTQRRLILIRPSGLLCRMILIFLGGTSSLMMAMASEKGKVEVKVGVVLDMEDVWVGKMGWSCISMSISDFYSSHSHFKTRIVLIPRDSKKDTVGAAASAVNLLKEERVEAIIGPSTTQQASFVINLGERTEVPIISFSATSPFLFLPHSPYFIQATLNDSAQVKAIGSLVQAFGWREVVPIFIKNEYGKGIIPPLIDVLQKANTRVLYQSAIHPSASDDQILQELRNLKEMESKVFIVHTTYALGARILTKAKQIGMMEKGYGWILTDGISNFFGSFDPSVIDSMQGVLGVKPSVPQSERLDEFKVRWKNKSNEDYPKIGNPEVNYFGLWAYDAATALAMAIEKVGYRSKVDIENLDGSGNLTELETLPFSQNGKRLKNVLSNMRFQGLSGDFHIVDGQLQSSSFTIVNLYRHKEWEIGFWTPKSGIVRSLDDTSTSHASHEFSREVTKSIIWPGFTTDAPKSGIRKLRIGLPLKSGYFINVTFDPKTNTTTQSGYCIDLFDAVMKAIPYHVPYEYVAFVNSSGRSAGGYFDLIHQVYVENFDAVVGDITIIANRSNYVDFTIPFSGSGVALVVPTKDKRPKTTWVFLKPLTWDLWVTSTILFTFIAFVIWVLEHGNPEFGGSPSRQISTSLWYSFSIMVFAHREQLVSHLARFVVIIWCFVVLILTQSYTASFTSFLTVQKLEPTITSVQDLLKRTEMVGYPKYSFVRDMLQQRKIDVSHLRQYDNMTHLNKELAAGSENGGIIAAFDEIPYMRRFVAQHCPKYIIVEVIQNTSGFGFAFQKGSPLVGDVSRAILNVTEGDKALEFPSGTDCRDRTTSLSSNVINLSSFGALFLIVFVSSSLALIIFMAMVIYDHRQFFLHLDIRALLLKFLLMHASPTSEGGGREEGNDHDTPRRQIPLSRNSAQSQQRSTSPTHSLSYDTDRSSREGSPVPTPTSHQEIFPSTPPTTFRCESRT